MQIKKFINGHNYHDLVCQISLKKVFFKNKLPEFIGKAKDLWKAFKSLGLPSKSGGCIIGALAENKILKHYTQSILKTFKSFYSDLP